MTTLVGGIDNAGTGGGGTPGGVNGDIQFNNSGSFGGVTPTGTGAPVLATGATTTNLVVGTQTAGDNSTKAASTAYADNEVPTEASSSGGGFISNGFEPVQAPTLSTNSVLVGSANQVRAVQFVLQKRTIINKTTVQIGTLSAGGVVVLGIYSCNSNGTPNAILQESVISTSATGVITQSQGSFTVGAGGVTLQPGRYWFAYGCDNTTARFTIITTFNDVNFSNVNFARAGTAANGLSGGVFQASLGTITGAGINPLVVLFET